MVGQLKFATAVLCDARPTIITNPTSSLLHYVKPQVFCIREKLRNAGQFFCIDNWLGVTCGTCYCCRSLKQVTKLSCCSGNCMKCLLSWRRWSSVKLWLQMQVVSLPYVLYLLDSVLFVAIYLTDFLRSGMTIGENAVLAVVVNNCAILSTAPQTDDIQP